MASRQIADKYAEGCRTLLQFGEHLLDLLQRPISAESTQQIQLQIEQRGAAIEELNRLAESVPGDAVATNLLRALAEQQVVLEESLQQAISDLKKQYVGSQAAQSSLESFRRIMRNDTRSQRLNKRT